MTHDLIKNICKEFGIQLKEVLINNLDNGIFYSKLICESNGKPIEIDSRTSDAIALALRFDSPIYTYEFILDQAALSIDPQQETTTTFLSTVGAQENPNPDDYSKKSISELQEQLNKLLEKEEYERATAIRDEIKRRSQST